MPHPPPSQEGFWNRLLYAFVRRDRNNRSTDTAKTPHWFPHITTESWDSLQEMSEKPCVSPFAAARA